MENWIIPESTVVANAEVLLVYGRYIFKNSIQEDGLLKSYTTGVAILILINQRLLFK